MVLPVTREFEAAVMERMWSYDHAVQSGELLRDLRGGREVTQAALARALGRLSRKGWLRRERVGRTHLYQAAVSREAHVDRLVRDALALRGGPRRSSCCSFPRRAGRIRCAAR